MRVLEMNEIEAVSGAITAAQLSNNLYLASGGAAILAAMTWWAPPVSATLAVASGGFGALGAVAGMMPSGPSSSPSSAASAAGSGAFGSDTGPVDSQDYGIDFNGGDGGGGGVPAKARFKMALD